MKRIIVIAVMLTAIMFSGISEGGEISKVSLDMLLALSGTNKQVSEFPHLLRLGMEQARRREESFDSNPSLSDSQYEQLVSTMTQAFKPEDILRSISREVKRSVSEQDAGLLLTWYKSKLGKEINGAEKIASTPKAYRQMNAAVKNLMADKKRVQFAKKLDSILHITDTTMQIQVDTSLAMFVAFSSEINPHQPVNTKAFRKQLSAHLRKGRPEIERLVVISTVYAYRKIDMDSLKKYLAFLKSPEAMRFNKSLITGREMGMDKSMEHMARSVVNLFKESDLQQI